MNIIEHIPYILIAAGAILVLGGIAGLLKGMI